MQSKDNHKIVLIQTKHPHIYDVKLNLDFQTRFIGKLDTAGDGTFITNRKEQHLFRKLNALGLSYELLSSANIRFKNILINYCGKKLLSTREYFLKKGKPFQFGNKGFELQVFVPLPDINLKTAKEFENHFCKQEDLFSAVA